jgi:peptidoglycan hydrolase CwlO-like protein
MSRETQVPAIPAVGESNLLQAVQAVKNALDVREGRLGDPLDQFVTLRELKALGLASDGETSLTTVGGTGRLPVIGSNGGAFGPDNYNESNDLTTPPPPTQLEAIGLYSSISLSWGGNNYRNHAYTEIWRSDTDNLGSASLVGTTIGNLYNDPVGTERTCFYWVRFVSQANVTGPYNSTSGTSASTALDVLTRLEILRQEILNDPLTIELGTRINRLEAVTGLGNLAPLEPLRLSASSIDVNNYIPPSVKAELDAVKASLDREKSVRGSAVISVERVTRDQATRISSLGTRVGGAESTITTLQSTTANQATQINTLSTRVGSAESSITTLQTTTATQATSVQTLTTRVGEAESSITSLQSTTASQATSINSLTTRVGSAESSISSLQTTTAGQATSITSLTTRLDGAESSITSLQQTTAYQATSITSLSTRVGTAESSIVTLQNTTSSQATQISSLSTTVGQKNRTFAQDDAPTGSSYTVNDAWYDTNDGFRLYRWNGSSWADSSDSRFTSQGSAITSLQSTTATQATSISSLTTRVGTAESNIGSLQTTTSSQATSISSLTTRVGNAETSIVNLQSTTSSQATSISQLTSSVSSNTTSIQTLTSTTNGLSGQYTVKIDNNGHVSGFGLASTTTTAGPTSAFIVRSDRFAIVGPNDATDPLGTTSPTNVPFVVLTTPTTIGGKVYPAGVWMKSTYIADATITSAQIETLSATKITAGTITASIDLQSPTVRSGSISPGTAGFYLGQFGGVNQFYVGNGSTGVSGRALQFDGTNATVRGNIFAYGGTIGGVLIDSSGISSTNYVSGSSGFSLNQSGVAEFQNLTARGNIQASSLQAGVAMVTTANIVDGNITSAKIGDAQITSAKIGNAEVGTLKIGGNAVTVPSYGSTFVDYTTFTASWYTVMSMTVPVSGLQSGEYIGLIVNSVSSIYPADSVATDVILGIFINGTLVTELAASISGYGFSHGGSGYALVTNGSNTVEFKYRVNANKVMTIATYATALAGKR